MAHYPQLLTGALVQFPFTEIWSTRTAESETAGGVIQRLSDAEGKQVRWKIQYQGLAEAEAHALQQHFIAMAGRLRTFTFVSPQGNILAHSDDLSAAAWSSDPALAASVAAGVNSLVNAGQTDQRLWQFVPVPRSFRYTLSFRARANAEATLRAGLWNAGEEDLALLQVSTSWDRYVLTARLGTAGEGVRAGFELPLGAAIEIADVQLEAQPGASAYQATGARSGVFPNTRFDMDSLTLTSLGADNHLLAVELLSKVD